MQCAIRHAVRPRTGLSTGYGSIIIGGFTRRGFVARMCRISLGVLNGIDEGRFQPGVLSCLSNIIPRDAVTFPGKGIE